MGRRKKTDPPQYPHTEDAIQYAKDVVSGKILACKWVIRACERQLDDMKRSRKSDPAFPFRWAPEKAEHVCWFIEKLPHIKGEWAGKPIRLEPWQKFILCVVFGWYRKGKGGKRRFRTCYVEVPRKNAKSTLSSGVALYMLVADGEGGAEVYSAATTRDQAKIVFRDAQEMARKARKFKGYYGAHVGAHNIHVLRSASKMEALSADGSTLDGLNIHFSAVDELHAHRSRSVWDVLETATGARSQPLIWAITTAGSNRAGICYEQRTYTTKILDRVHADETYFGIIYTIDDEDDWSDPEIWAKANPNLGVSIYPDDMARLCAKALQMPAAVNNFLTKRLDVWVSADTAWMDMRAWERCVDTDLKIEDFKGQPCILGLDLASKRDMAALVAVFRRDDTYFAFSKFYLPEETAEHSANSQYSGWAREGRLTLTPGNVTDFAFVEDDLRAFSSMFDVQEIAFDPFQATQLSTRMAQEGAPMVEMRATVQNFSEPMKELEALVLQQKLKIDGDPILTWMISNVVAHLDAKDNIYPRKERPENLIDGVVALIMALGRWFVVQDTKSVYENRGVIAL